MKYCAAIALFLFPLACNSGDDASPPGGGKADDAKCEGARLDSKGVCRQSNGQFAPKACCEIAEEPSVICSFRLPKSFGFTSTEMQARAVSTREFSNKKAAKLGKEDAERFIRAAVHLTFIEAGDDLAAAIDSIDEDSLELIELHATDTDQDLKADWVKFHAGDTEVGVVFRQLDQKIIGEVSDGDVLGCIAADEILHCAGFLGGGCDEGLECIDVPGDTCDPENGGFDCGGMCVPEVIKVCGGLVGFQCDEDEFCDFGSNCGFADQLGDCKKRPEVCTQDLQPACGCDGMTYGNACKAAAAGADVFSEGACECGLSRCDVGTECCNSLTGVCVEPGQVCAF